MADFVLAAEVIVEAKNAITDVDRLGNTLLGIDANLAIVADQLAEFMVGFKDFLVVNDNLKKLTNEFGHLRQEIDSITFDRVIPPIEQMTETFKEMIKQLVKMQKAIQAVEKGMRAMVMFMMIMNDMDIEDVNKKFGEMEGNIGKILRGTSENLEPLKEGTKKTEEETKRLSGAFGVLGKGMKASIGVGWKSMKFLGKSTGKVIGLFNPFNLNLKKLALGMSALGAITGGVFAYMLKWSPSLQAAFALMKLDIGLAAMEIGEVLAPIIEGLLLPMTNKFLEVITNLSPEMKTFIAVVIGLSVGVGALGGALLVVGGILTFLLSPIGLIVAGLVLLAAAVYTWGDEVFVVLGNVQKYFNLFIDVIQEKLSDWLSGLEKIPYVGKAIKAAVEFIFYAVLEFIQILGNAFMILIDAIARLFSGDYSGFIQGLYNLGAFILQTVSNIVNFVIDMLNNFFDWVDKATGGLVSLEIEFEMPSGEEMMDSLLDIAQSAGAAVGATFGNAASEVLAEVNTRAKTDTAPPPDVPVFHSGGVFMGDRPGLALLKPNERVLTETEQRSLGLKGGSTGGQGMQTITHNYNITINGGTYTSPAQRRMEAEKFAKQLETQSNSRGFI